MTPTGCRASPIANFSWVIDGRLAGMARPDRGGDLERAAAFLREQGISVLVSLTETAPDGAVLARFEIELVHVPIPDFCAPRPEQLDAIVAAYRRAMACRRAVGVHCFAGIGRTGTVLAVLLAAQGMAPRAAIARVRHLRPGSIETREQERAVAELSARF